MVAGLHPWALTRGAIVALVITVPLLILTAEPSPTAPESTTVPEDPDPTSSP